MLNLIGIPQHLRRSFSNFSPIFNNIVVSNKDIGNLMKEYTEIENIIAELKEELISSFNFTNRGPISPSVLI